MGDASNKEMKSRRDNTDDPVAIREQQLWDMARPKYDAIMARHIQLPVEEHSSNVYVDDENDNVASSVQTTDANRRKRLIYRAKQRGWLEVDLLLGTWANIHVPTLNTDQLNEFENFVNMETIDIYNVLTLRSDVPDEMKSGREGDGSSNSRTIVEQIQDWVKESPLGKADQEKYHEVKTKNNLI